MKDLIPPVVDLSPLEGCEPSSDAWRAVAREFDNGMRKHGVVYAANYGVPPALESSLRSLASSFFSESLEAKERFAFSEKYGDEGYACVGKEIVALSYGDTGGSGYSKDLVESIVLFSRSSEACPPALRDAVSDYMGRMERLLATLMQLMDLALEVPPPGLSAGFQEPVNAFKLSNYPVNGGDGIGEGYGAHTDFSGYTFLSQDTNAAFPKQGSFQVFVDGEWRSVPPKQDTILINAGDFIERWTNGAYKSPLHRVVFSKNRTVPRLSIVYFTSPANDFVVEPLAQCCSEDVPAKYKPIVAGEYLWERVARIGTTAEGN